MDHGMSSDDVVTVTLEPGLTLEQVKVNPMFLRAMAEEKQQRSQAASRDLTPAALKL